jgi:hypothetical protein
MHFLGIFKEVLQRVCRQSDYHIGPRGNRTSKFEVYLKSRKDDKDHKIYTYNGQEELDYSLFTDNEVFVIEAKNLIDGGLDMGWHKIAYPLTRFSKFSFPKYPCYFLKQGKLVWIFIFPEFKYHNNGIVLNDKTAMAPEHIFRVDLNSLGNKVISS